MVTPVVYTTPVFFTLKRCENAILKRKRTSVNRALVSTYFKLVAKTTFSF